MIIIYKTPTCAYCKMVAKYLDHVGVAYRFEEAEGEPYSALAEQYGWTVPLTFNDKTKEGMVGYHITNLRKLIGIA